MKSKKEYDMEQKLYNQFMNKLLILLWTGFSLGGCLLAALDYILVAQIPERHPIVLGLFWISGMICSIYWVHTFIKAKGIDGLRGLAVFGLILSMLASCSGIYGMWENTRNLRTYFQGEQIVIKDKKETAMILLEYMETWKHTPNYCLTYVAEDVFYATVYNEKGESVSQLVVNGEDSGLDDIAVCLTDGTAVIITNEKVERRQDVDNLTYISHALQWVVDGKAEISRVSTTEELVDKGMAHEDAMPGTEYTITISGLNNLQKFYGELIGTEEAESMLQAFVGVDVAIMYSILLDSGYIGVASIIAMDGESNLLWFIDNYTEVYDFELGSEDWYDYDFSDAEKNERMIEEVMYNVSVMLETYGDFVGIDWEGSFNIDSEGKDFVEFKDGQGQTVILHATGEFYAVLSHGLIKEGNYAVSEDATDITFTCDGVSAKGKITGEVLILPDEWSDEHSHGKELTLVK